jgi:hypothetical protein
VTVKGDVSELDLGRLYRIVGALDGLADVTSDVASPMPSAEGVPILNRLRGLGRAAVEALDTERAELLVQLLHPDFFGDAEIGSFTARASLGVLRGYLHGCLTELELESQLQANAQAYAEAKVRAERGIGFVKD